jgi:hypothetical protein
MTKEEFVLFIEILGFTQTWGSNSNSFSLSTDVIGKPNQNYMAFADQLKISIDNGLAQLSLSQMSTHMMAGKSFGNFSLETFGDDNDLVTEDSPLNPDTEGGRQLAIVENVLQKNRHFQTTILRFGGLIGEDRNPVRFLSGRENIENPNAPINLIHQDDCIGIIEKIIALNSWNKTYNAVTPFHPSRKEYYSQKATELNLALPKFAASNTVTGKTILSDYLIKSLQHSFIKPRL